MIEKRNILGSSDITKGISCKSPKERIPLIGEYSESVESTGRNGAGKTSGEVASMVAVG